MNFRLLPLLVPAFLLTASAGAVTDRKFDFFDRNYRFDADGGFFVALSLKGSY